MSLMKNDYTHITHCDLYTSSAILLEPFERNARKSLVYTILFCIEVKIRISSFQLYATDVKRLPIRRRVRVNIIDVHA